MTINDVLQLSITLQFFFFLVSFVNIWVTYLCNWPIFLRCFFSSVLWVLAVFQYALIVPSSIWSLLPWLLLGLVRASEAVGRGLRAQGLSLWSQRSCLQVELLPVVKVSSLKLLLLPLSIPGREVSSQSYVRDDTSPYRKLRSHGQTNHQPQAKGSKTVNPSKLFYFLSWLFQVFYCSNGKLIASCLV